MAYYMNMIPEIQVKLESQGIMVYHKKFDFRTKTDTYIELPDGHRYDYYNYMHDIPDTLYNGEEISLGEQAIPSGAPIYTGNGCTNASCAAIWDGDNMLQMGQELIIPLGFIALIIFMIKLVAVFIVLYLLLEKILHPCGPVPFEDNFVDNCYKVITYPNCATITVNSCDPEGPKIVNETGSPGQDWVELIKWSIIGVIVIAGTLVAYNFLKDRGKAKPHTPSHEKRPPTIPP